MDHYFQKSSKKKSFLIINIDLIVDSYNHVNLVIFNKDTNTLEYYEPNGYISNNFWGKYSTYIEIVINILYTNLKLHITDIKFISSVKLHGFAQSDKYMLGLQAIEGRQNHTGHCQMWCYLIADLVTKFPEYSTQSIIKCYLDLNNKENLSKLNFHRKLKMIVRGFYFSSMKRLNKIDELCNLDTTYINSSDKKIISQTHDLIENIIF